ncbi:tyrosine-type recombinase/integrase [Aquimarina hainanensis]|uniref:Tyrosine-type recombinase/integrase n=1 Tax=Aquimarina hainanensis TaxID=1578017 RepID=A0ABW5N8X3_9FLAO
MQVSFYLVANKLDKKGLAPIYYSLTLNNQRIRKQVKGVKCLPSHWKKKEQRVKASLKSEEYNFHVEYNKTIDDLDSQFKQLFRYIHLNGIKPTKEFVLDKLNSGLEAVNLTNEFFPSFEEFIEKGKNIKTDGTLRRYRTALNFYKDFSEYEDYPLRFDTITVDFFEKFRDYAFEHKNTLNNYFSKLISVLKTFMNWSYDRGYHENLNFRKFKAPEQEIEVIYLTMDELMQLFNHKFDSQRLEHVKDTYCFGCFTGLRFSDIKQLRISNVYDDHLKLNIKKTKTIDHKIPLNNFAKQLLKKYKDTIYEPIPAISTEKFNKYIKECCQIAKINTPTSITRFIGKKRIDKTVPKHDLITSHTARKTFVTNSLVLGMKEMVVRNITGHKKEESFRRYVKIAEDLKRQEMDNTWDKL